MNRRRNLADIVGDSYDWIRFQIGDRWDRVAERLDDWRRWCFQRFMELFGLLIVRTTDWLSIPAPRGKTSAIRVFRVVCGTLLGVVFFACLQVLISCMALIGALFGLFRGKEYPLRDLINLWIPVGIFGLALPYLGVKDYALTQITMLLTYSIIVLGLNVLVGSARLISIGHAAFVMLGAYITVWFYRGDILQMPLWASASVFLGGLFTAVLGLGLSYPAVRVKDQYLILVTLAFMFSMPSILKSEYLSEYVGSGLGGLTYSTPAPPELLASMPRFRWMYYLTLGFFTALFIFAHIILNRTKVGRAFKAIRDGEERSHVLGINVPLYKSMLFSFSALYAGVGGGLIALSTGYLEGETFTIKDSLDYLVAVAVGGLGSIFGSVVGGAFLASQVYVTQFLAGLLKSGDQLLWVVYGIILIVIMIFAPGGIVGTLGHKLYKTAFKIPKRRYHRRDPYPDYELDEELIAVGSHWTVDATTRAPEKTPRPPRNGLDQRTPAG